MNHKKDKLKVVKISGYDDMCILLIGEESNGFYKSAIAPIESNVRIGDTIEYIKLPSERGWFITNTSTLTNTGILSTNGSTFIKKYTLPNCLNVFLVGGGDITQQLDILSRHFHDKIHEVMYVKLPENMFNSMPYNGNITEHEEHPEWFKYCQFPHSRRFLIIKKMAEGRDKDNYVEDGICWVQENTFGCGSFPHWVVFNVENEEETTREVYEQWRKKSNG